MMGKLAPCLYLKDRLSSLPDDILIDCIMPLLTLEEAARTSLLSQRWRFLWLSLPELNFDASETAGRISVKRKKTYLRAASKYIKWVNRVVGDYRGSGILRRLRIRFPLDKTASHDIDSWLVFSLQRGVQVLDLDCCQDDRDITPLYVLNFPSLIDQSRQQLIFPKLRMLKSLFLKDIAVTTESLEHLLLGCELLERLELRELELLDRVNITVPMLRLLYIHIGDCCELKSVMISAPTPNLVSLRILWPVRTCHVEHAPRLIDLLIRNRLDTKKVINPMLPYFSQLQALDLQISEWREVMDWLPLFIHLGGLKHLALNLLLFGDRQSFVALTSMIRAVPSLEHLTLQVNSFNKKKMPKGIDGLHLQYLRVLEFTSFTGSNGECCLATYLLRHTPSLEKVIIDRRCPLRWGNIYGEYPTTKESKLEERRIRALELKQELLPPEVDLVVI